jgi:hypothetical protein
MATQEGVQRRYVPGAGCLGRRQMQRIAGAQGALRVQHQFGSAMERSGFYWQQAQVRGNQTLEVCPCAARLRCIDCGGALL